MTPERRGAEKGVPLVIHSVSLLNMEDRARHRHRHRHRHLRFLVVFCLPLFLSLHELPPLAQSLWTPKDLVFINCGAFQNMTIDGQLYIADEGSAFVSGGMAVSTFTNERAKPSRVEYHTARIFTINTSYQVPIHAGVHWVRLHFYAFESSIFNTNFSVFSVQLEDYLLLDKAAVAAEIVRRTDKRNSFIIKEYSVNSTGPFLCITFSPAKPNETFAFISVIEVESMPADEYKGDAIYVSDKQDVRRKLEMAANALQTMHRLNMGGPSIVPAEDSGQFRNWISDNAFMRGSTVGRSIEAQNVTIKYSREVPEYIAPLRVYSTARAALNSSFNLTWAMPVDVGYLYLVRLHLCEFGSQTSQKRLFNVYLNNLTAFSGLDLMTFVPRAVAYYLDFAIPVLEEPKVLWVEIGSSSDDPASNFKDGILNGLEILKLSNSARSLVGSSSFELLENPAFDQSRSKKRRKGHFGVIIATSVVALVVLGFVLAGSYRSFRKLMQKKAPDQASHLKWQHVRPLLGSAGSYTYSRGSHISSSVSSLARTFSFLEVLDATNNFHESMVIGAGGFGLVYRGIIDGGIEVAVKRGNPHSEQGLTEFETEVELLSKLRHRHLVSLIGYCDEEQEMILLYEFMPNGCLKHHLYGSDRPSLSWTQRLQICIGAAKGLHYLHTGASRGVIHRDVKTSNILLDKYFVAKMSDFGLSKMRASPDNSHVSTAVKGSFGYLDPEYYRRRQLTEKSDVYSFGVVLLEVVCARAAVDSGLSREQVNLCEWALHYQKQGLLQDIMDPKLMGENCVTRDSLHLVGKIAEACLEDKAFRRPFIGDVLWMLEYALHLHETAALSSGENLPHEHSSTGRILYSDAESKSLSSSDNITFEDHRGGDTKDASVSTLFSEMVNPQRR